MKHIAILAFAVLALAGCDNKPAAVATDVKPVEVNVSKLCKALDTAEKCATDARCVWAEAGKDAGDKPHCKDK